MGIFSQSLTHEFFPPGGAGVAFLAGLAGACWAGTCWAATVATVPGMPAHRTNATTPARRVRLMLGHRDGVRCIRSFPRSQPVRPREIPAFAAAVIRPAHRLPPA